MRRAGRTAGGGSFPEAVIERFLACGVLVQEDGALFWRKSVHAPVPLNRVLSMAEGRLVRINGRSFS